MGSAKQKTLDFLNTQASAPEVPEEKLPAGVSGAQPVTLTLVIKGVVPSKKNKKHLGIRKDGTPYLTTSKQHKKFHNEKMPELREWLKLQEEKYSGRVCFPIATQTAMKVIFTFCDHRVRDLVEKQQTIQDMLKDAGIIYDDCQFILAPVMLDYRIKRKTSITHIYLTVRDSRL